MTAITKVTAKGQTTIPQEIRAALKVKHGDLLAWDIAANVLLNLEKLMGLKP